MKNHPYLRAYLAGIAVPTLFLLVMLGGFAIARFGFDTPIRIEKAIAFPMALVPNLWGLWNILYVRMHSRRWVSIGAHGALLPLLLLPIALAVVTTVLAPIDVSAMAVAGLFAVAVAVYYVAWSFAVGFLNRELGIA